MHFTIQFVRNMACYGAIFKHKKHDLGDSMKKINVGINGVGRIGRTILREIAQRAKEGENLAIQVTAVNNPGNPDPYVHLLKYDSVHGTAQYPISLEGSKLNMNGNEIAFYGEKDPAQIPWEESNVDIVIDATGRFKDKESLGKHLGGSVKKVIMCAPGKDLDGTFVIGINDEKYDPQSHTIFSNASCTTNCLAPVAKVLHETFEIESGFMTTVHAYTSDQNILDNSHSDLRRARAAALSMIPTTTGAAKAVGIVFPELKGKLDGFAIRVPTPNVSLVDLTVNVKKSATKESVNEAIKKASEGNLKGILAYTDEPLVSQDFRGRRESSVFDTAMTNVIGNTVKIVTWYDNEAGYSNRIIDLANFVAGKL
jgi:glyceraldehyde 3-phosphate dehydrogenase